MTGFSARHIWRCVFVVLLITSRVAWGQATYDYDPAAAEQARADFIARMVDELGFSRQDIEPLIASAAIDESILAAISRPAERVVPWYDYRNIFLNESRIDNGVAFWREHADTISQIADEYGVDPQIIVAIVGVETLYGQRMGRYRVVDALSTLAFAYPPRAAFFTRELEAFLMLNREEAFALNEALGSYAGAMGAGQFIPSSFRAYAVDGDGDGRRDLWSNWDDILSSVANYLGEHGWRAGEPTVVPAIRTAAAYEPTNELRLDDTVGAAQRGGYQFSVNLPEEAAAAVYSFESDANNKEYWAAFNNFYVITRYNRSTKYALAVYQLATEIQNAYLLDVSLGSNTEP